MIIRYIDTIGTLKTVEGVLSTGAKDSKGREIFEGDIVNVYIPTLDQYKRGTVIRDIEDAHPQWLIKLDEKVHHTHVLSDFHGIPSYDTEYHYLDGNYCNVVYSPTFIKTKKSAVQYLQESIDILRSILGELEVCEHESEYSIGIEKRIKKLLSEMKKK